MNIHPSTIPADNPPDYMSHNDGMRARTAARRVKRLYPGIVGDILSREIDACADMRFRLDQNALIARLIDHVLEPPGEAVA